MNQSNAKRYTEQDKEIIYQIVSLFLKDIDEAFEHMYEINDQLKEEVEYTVHGNDKTFFNSTFTTPYEVIEALNHDHYEPTEDYIIYFNHGEVISFDRDHISGILRADMLTIVELILQSVDKVNFAFKPDIAELIDQLSDAFPRRQN